MVRVKQMSVAQPLVFPFTLLYSCPRADALYCLLAQAAHSLMVREKQMSAAQPLVFLPRPLYHKENVKKPLFSMFLLKYISPASRFICKSQLFHSHQIWHMLITYSSHTHPEDN